MIRQADFTIYGQDGNLRLAVEVRGKRDASPEWIQEMRHNLYAYEAIPLAPFFLLALPDYLHLWRESEPRLKSVPPDFTVETGSVLKPYLGQPQLPLHETSEFVLEMLVRAWLVDLVRGYRVPDEAAADQRWLFDSGLYEAIKHGEVATLTPV